MTDPVARGIYSVIACRVYTRLPPGAKALRLYSRLLTSGLAVERGSAIWIGDTGHRRLVPGRSYRSIGRAKLEGGSVSSIFGPLGKIVIQLP